MSKKQWDHLIQLWQVSGHEIQFVCEKDRNRRTKFVQEYSKTSNIESKVTHVPVKNK